MPDYDSEKCEDNEWRNRFPNWAVGSENWRNLPDPFEWQPGIPLAGLPDLRSRDDSGTPLNCPRVFVSYRQPDRKMALRVAWIAKSQGFDFWLDVLDPNLQNPGMQGLPQPQRAIATATIIEMGLLNCSHIIALITQNTKGSVWVPYEYGRVKDVPPVSIQASCWRHPQQPMAQLPEYLLLGAVHHSEGDICSWLTGQLQAWITAHGKCWSGSDRTWKGDLPDPLPDQ